MTAPEVRDAAAQVRAYLASQEGRLTVQNPLADDILAALDAQAADLAAAREEVAGLRGRVESLARRIDLHRSIEFDVVEFRDSETGVWHDVATSLRAALAEPVTGGEGA